MVVYPAAGVRYMVTESPLCSMYFNSLLANLNARRYVGQRDGGYNAYQMESQSNGPNALVSKKTSGTQSGGTANDVRTVRSFHLTSNKTLTLRPN